MQSICRRLHRCRENQARRVSGKLQHTLCRNPGAYTGCLHNILNKEAKLLLEKWKNDPEKRDKLMKAAAVLIILAVIFLSFDVFTQNRDGRKQIIDSDGGTETELCSILSDIDGVGAVDVMLQYGEKDQVAGVIVTAEGAGNPVVKNDLIKAVMALFDISSANVEVVEKTSASDMEKDKEEKSNGQ